MSFWTQLGESKLPDPSVCRKGCAHETRWQLPLLQLKPTTRHGDSYQNGQKSKIRHSDSCSCSNCPLLSPWCRWESDNSSPQDCDILTYLEITLPFKLAWYLEWKSTTRVLHIAKEEKVKKEPLYLCHDAVVELPVHLRGLLLQVHMCTVKTAWRGSAWGVDTGFQWTTQLVKTSKASQPVRSISMLTLSSATLYIQAYTAYITK